MFDVGLTTFMILATSMVMLMTPGLAFFYGVLGSKKHVLNIMMQSFVSLGLTTVLWFFFVNSHPLNCIPLNIIMHLFQMNILILKRSLCEKSGKVWSKKNLLFAGQLFTIPSKQEHHNLYAELLTISLQR